MNTERKGWVVINSGHPSTGQKYICESTFSYSRRKAIKDFIDGTNKDWRYWRRKYNFRVVKASQTIKTF